jgi:hypothetical protein
MSGAVPSQEQEAKMVGQAAPHGGPYEDVVLAALGRALLHEGSAPADPIPLWTLRAHLALQSRSAAARELRRALDALERQGLVARSCRRGVPVWTLTAWGARRLAQRRRSGRVPPLPESPQHRTWRVARHCAQTQLEPFRHELAETLAEAARLLEAGRAGAPSVSSDDWFELAVRLRATVRQLGSATHILHEWQEPGESRADVDDLGAQGDELLAPELLAKRRAARAGRRNTRLWQKRS